MCNPVFALLAVTTAVSAYGQIQQGKAAEAAAEAQGQQINRQAGQELDAANAQADLIRKAARRQAAESRAAFSASGVATDEGTPLKIAEDIYRGGEYDALNTIITGGRRADTLSDEAVNVVRQGQAAKRAGYMGAVSSVLSTGAQAVGASGWRSAGPGFSGTQSAAPIRSVRIN